MLDCIYTTTDAWRRVLDHMRMFGATDRAHGLPVRSDDSLGGHANRLYRSTAWRNTGYPAPVLSNSMLQKMAPILRRAYDSDQGTPMIPMNTLANLLRKMGHRDIWMEQTSGGCALHVGPARRDKNGDDRHAAVAGPGDFFSDCRADPLGTFGEFAVGPDDDGDTKPHTIPVGATLESIATLIGMQVKATNAAAELAEAALRLRKETVDWGDALPDGLCEALGQQPPAEIGGDSDWREAVCLYELTTLVTTSAGEIPAGTYLRIIAGKQVTAYPVTGDARAYVEETEAEYIADEFASQAEWN